MRAVFDTMVTAPRHGSRPSSTKPSGDAARSTSRSKKSRRARQQERPMVVIPACSKLIEGHILRRGTQVLGGDRRGRE